MSKIKGNPMKIDIFEKNKNFHIFSFSLIFLWFLIFSECSICFIILKILDIIPGLGIQVAQQTESAGLDVSEHGERGYVQDGAD